MANDNFHHQNCGCSLHRKMEQDIYFSEEWKKGEEETRKALAEGNGITFPNAKEAIKWLKQGGIMDNLIDRFNKFFAGDAKINIDGNVLEITINHATLRISLPEVLGGYSS